MAIANTKLIPNTWRYNLAQDFVDDVVHDEDNNFYFFIVDHTDHANSVVQLLDDMTKTTTEDTFRNMIQGKRISNNDIRLMIRNIPWESNKAFTMYDDEVDLTDEDFYAIVNAASNYHVFKCLDNNGGVNSTSQPDFADISGANTEFYRTADGYAWKYMYSVTSGVVARFGTSNNFPVQANTEVQDLAVHGSIDVVKIEDGGLRYNNYLTGTFAGADIQVGGDPVVFQVSNSVVSGTNGFYTGCLLYISSGTGVGQYEYIEDYYANSFGNYIRLADTLGITPENGSTFQINPAVHVLGQGSQASNVVARALINSVASNAIYLVEVLDKAAGYQYATANVVANAVVGVTRTANLRPIHAPPGGHGFNPARELLCSKAQISVQLSNNEQNTVLVANKFQNFGIIRNPLFANVHFDLANVEGTFLDSESVRKMRSINITKVAAVNSLSTLITAADADFTLTFEAGDFVYLTIADGTSNQLAVVNNVVNATALYLTINAYFDSSVGYINIVNTHANCYVQNVVSAESFKATNVHGQIIAGDFIIGERSGAVAYIDTVTRNDVVKNYQTFVALHKYNGVVTFGSFEENEVVYQGNLATANALLHSIVDDGANTIIYVSNQVGLMVRNETIVGNTSGAVLAVSNTYCSELVYGSGDIIYLENIDAVTRQEDQTEKFKISFQF